MYTKSRGFVKDIDRTELLAMREQGMSNQEIAKSLAVSYTTIFNLIGRQPKELTDANRCRGQSRRQQAIRESRMGNMPANSMHAIIPTEEEVKEAVLVVQNTDIRLHGTVFDYRVSADRETVYVETADKQCLLQVQTAQIDALIKELRAIKNNAPSGTSLPFWG